MTRRQKGEGKRKGSSGMIDGWIGRRAGLKLTLERMLGRVVRRVEKGRRSETENTSHCGYRPDNAVPARVTVLRNWVKQNAGVSAIETPLLPGPLNGGPGYI
ncbi:hypothetical protein DMN91_008866 [Ooceraea biroi]|uniref:Uncharacterized protein n=1 Tax=Ooceraea biroi TaxID=2015173 RepID=A0A3L8DF39_OOCBI|nr:hypothetical protein DMN91_008866 [Ooceraea biroi]